jgi:hypothetical protein
MYVHSYAAALPPPSSLNICSRPSSSQPPVERVDVVKKQIIKKKPPLDFSQQQQQQTPGLRNVGRLFFCVLFVLAFVAVWRLIDTGTQHRLSLPLPASSVPFHHAPSVHHFFMHSLTIFNFSFRLNFRKKSSAQNSAKYVYMVFSQKCLNHISIASLGSPEAISAKISWRSHLYKELQYPKVTVSQL